MADFLQSILDRAASLNKTVVLPEASDERTLQAAKTISEKKFVKPVLIGNVDKVTAKLKEMGADTEFITVVDPATSPKKEQYAELFHELRKHKGMTADKAAEIIQDEIYFATMMVKAGDADGLVAGAAHSSADTIRPALQIIKAREGVKTVSSMFFMVFPDATYLFSDCGLNQDPNAEQLADIAVATAQTGLQFGFDPKVAMLSYSTKGSGTGQGAEKVVEATKLANAAIKERFGDKVAIDGELQFDAAFVPSVAEKKAPDSPLNGEANVFIFPDLGAGNICYKLTQRMAGADAYGPVLQGLDKPVNDLSRGCTADDIVATAAITAIQAEG
ncbi:Phosphate acetyltransferase [Anaerohalosphaera lusitana]|uniref:Phosphate acetyltransferase n=1 Tax=Anaerohalosphaera lusitana TaxID=1936003 RepID=A0A1U9NKV1_9BACT|nr:phosphate acetyltransferase [Anaerohalosphaera lusitana]AQT68539.1 Phosphate acetyltransferase [Anaerohalosphaera lusitana]